MEKNGWSGNDILKESWSCRAKHIKKIIRRLASKNEELYAFAINRIVKNKIFFLLLLISYIFHYLFFNYIL